MATKRKPTTTRAPLANQATAAMTATFAAIKEDEQTSSAVSNEPSTILAAGSCPSFLFGLGQQVSISASHESGIVIGRAEYLASERSYLLRYKANDGRATEAWWNESALAA